MATTEVKKLHTLTGHNDCVYALANGASDHLVFSGAGDGMVVSWNLHTPETGQLIAKLPNSIYALHFHRRQNILIAGHNYEGIHLLDAENKKEVGSLKLTTAAIFDIQSYQDVLLVASGEGRIQLVDLAALRVKKESQETDKSARCIAVHPSRGEVAVGYSDHFIRVFDLDNLALKLAWKAHNNSVFTIRYTPDGKQLISGSRDARLKVWDVQANYKPGVEVVAHMYAINHLDFSPDTKHFVTCSMDKSIKVWSTEEMKLLKVIDRSRHAGHATSVNKVLWTPYQNQMISASDDRTLSIWHIIF